jgi:hypothetical protein
LYIVNNVARKPAAIPPTAATTKINRNLLVIGRRTTPIKKAKTVNMKMKERRGEWFGWAPPT